MRKKWMSILAICAMATVMVTGCGNSETQTKKENKTEASDIKKEEKETISEKVVASSVAVVEILDALGVPMVGVPTSSYDLPESVADATKIGNPMSPDMEEIASLEPTVVVSVDSLSEDLKTQFENLGAESCFVNLSSYDGLKESIQSLGKRFEAEKKAEELLKKFEEKETTIAKEIKGKEAPKVLIIFGAGTSFMAASEDSYVGDLAKRAGAVNIIQDAPSAFSPVDMEYIAAKNPDYILFMAHANPEESMKAFKEEVANNAAWQNFDAVKNDKLVTLENRYFGMSANLLAADAMEKLVEILY